MEAASPEAAKLEAPRPDAPRPNAPRPDAPDPAHPRSASRPGVATPRRAVLMGAGAVGAAAFLAACGTSQSGGTYGTNPIGSDYQADPAPAGSGPADAGNPHRDGGAAGGSGSVLAATADVPQGGGIIKGDYVITQPTSGTFKAFSKVCTHQGCDVNRIDGGLILCPCHGSQFSIEDGSVKGGPAPRPLPQTRVKVSGQNVVKA
jgi:Rieske Fe-S protein